MPSPRGWQRLARLAAPLQPAQPPYHVQAPRRGHESPGWYWRPADAEQPTYLGFNHIRAELRLTELLEDQEAHAA